MLSWSSFSCQEPLLHLLVRHISANSESTTTHRYLYKQVSFLFVCLTLNYSPQQVMMYVACSQCVVSCKLVYLFLVDSLGYLLKLGKSATNLRLPAAALYYRFRLLLLSLLSHRHTHMLLLLLFIIIIIMYLTFVGMKML